MRETFDHSQNPCCDTIFFSKRKQCLNSRIKTLCLNTPYFTSQSSTERDITYEGLAAREMRVAINIHRPKVSALALDWSGKWDDSLPNKGS